MSKAVKTVDKKSVLIVEDSVDFANLLKFIVDDMGHEGIQFALDKEDIVEVSKERKPNVILMDLQLRRKNGLTYIEELKSDVATKDIPIIIITGRELNQREQIELQMKDVKYLRKGRVEMDDLKKTIYDTLESAG